MFICCRGLRPSSKFQCVYMSIHSRFSAYRFRLVFICCMDLKESSEHGMGMFGKGAPKGGWGCLMFFPMSGISGLSFDSPFLSPLLFFCLVLLLFLSCLFSHPSGFEKKNLKHHKLRVRLFCMALVEHLGDDSW